MFWNKQIETLPAAEMRVWQNHTLQKMLERVEEKSQFYQKRLQQCGIKAGEPFSLEDLGQLPLTEDKEVRDHYPYGLLTLPLSGVAYIKEDGMMPPGVMCYTETDLQVGTALMARQLVAGGLNVTSVLQVMPGGGGLGSMLLQNAARLIGAALLPAESLDARRQLQLLDEFRPTAVFGGQSLDCLQERAWLHQVFYSLPENSKEQRSRLQTLAGTAAREIYGLELLPGLPVGGECQAGAGLHLHTDCFYPEIADTATGRSLPEGTEGELILTSLVLEAMPFLRLRTGSIGRLSSAPCSCGRTLTRFIRS